MQHGSLIKNIRKHGPGVWQFRWSEKSPQGKRIYRKRVIGSVGDYSDVDAARRAVAGLLREINSGETQPRSCSMTIAQLCEHFVQRELARENTWRSYSTKKTYGVYRHYVKDVPENTQSAMNLLETLFNECSTAGTARPN